MIAAVTSDKFSPSTGGTAILIATICDSSLIISFNPMETVFPETSLLDVLIS